MVILSQAGTTTWGWGAFLLVAGCWKLHFCISQGFLVVSDRNAQLSTFLASATEWSGAEGAACVGWSRSLGSISLPRPLLLSFALFSPPPSSSLLPWCWLQAEPPLGQKKSAAPPALTTISPGEEQTPLPGPLSRSPGISSEKTWLAWLESLALGTRPCSQEKQGAGRSSQVLCCAEPTSALGAEGWEGAISRKESGYRIQVPER